MTAYLRMAVAGSLVVSLFATTGCENGTTDVSGKVTFNGKPVVYGTVVVVGSNGIPKAGAIQPDGSYQISGVALGPAKSVTVSSPRPPGSAPPQKQSRDSVDEDKKLPPPPPPAPPEVIQNWTALPERYADPGKSDLTATIKSGEPLNLDLK